jgi:enoyl-CoA hydratase/carnithine racemase
MLGEIGTALDELERDAGVRALIVTGAGAAVSSGFDPVSLWRRLWTGGLRVARARASWMRPHRRGHAFARARAG